MPADTSTPTVTAGAPPTADAQDPLPESNFLWRRVFAFAVIFAVLMLLWLHVADIGDVARRGSREAIEGLVRVSKLELYLIALIATYYLLAPSAEQMTKMIQTARMLRSGVSMRSSATATGPDGTAVTASEAGPAAPLALVDSPPPTATPPPAAVTAVQPVLELTELAPLAEVESVTTSDTTKPTTVETEIME